MKSARLPAALLATIVGLVLVLAPAAGAEAATRIDDVGWWWRAQTGLAVTLPPPPNVEEGQLMVQSSPEGAQAIAAVSIVIAEGRVNPILTLDIANEQGVAQGVVLACQAGATWTGTFAGRWDSKPPADCSTSVTGILSDDGTQMTFPAGPLQFNDKLNVVIVPGVAAGSDAYSSFSVVFEAPTAASVATVAGTPPTVATSTTTSTSSTIAAPPTTTAAFTPPPPRATVPASSTTAPPPTAPLPAQPALDPEDQGLTATAPVLNDPVSSQTSSRGAARLLGVVVLLAGVAGSVWVLRNPTFGGAVATADTPIEGGLARFRAERTSEPTPVS